MPRAPRRKVMVIASLAFSLVNFRGRLLERMAANGHDVIAVAPDMNTEIGAKLDDIGVGSARIFMERTGLNPLSDLRTFRSIMRLMKRERPDVVLTYTAKPTVYGGLAARFCRVPEFYALFTGMGYAFNEANPTGRRRLARSISILLHRVGLKSLKKGFVYNSTDLAELRDFGMVPVEADLIRVSGSGVDTDHFKPAPSTQDGVHILFVGRLLRSKGLAVLADAARMLKEQGVAFTLDIVGPEDANPDAIDPEELRNWAEEGLIVCHGGVSDVRPFLRDCAFLVLPNIAREGTPRAVLEALAMGRPAITTDAPGSKEAIRDGESGLIVPAGDAAQLADAMRQLIEDPDLLARMGEAARAFALEVHDVNRVNQTLLVHMGLEEACGTGQEPEATEDIAREQPAAGSSAIAE